MLRRILLTTAVLAVLASRPAGAQYGGELTVVADDTTISPRQVVTITGSCEGGEVVTASGVYAGALASYSVAADGSFSGPLDTTALIVADDREVLFVCTDADGAQIGSTVSIRFVIDGRFTAIPDDVTLEPGQDMGISGVCEGGSRVMVWSGPELPGESEGLVSFPVGPDGSYGGDVDVGRLAEVSPPEDLFLVVVCDSAVDPITIRFTFVGPSGPTEPGSDTTAAPSAGAAPTGGTLVRTGSTAEVLAKVGALLIVAGAAVALASRRRTAA